MSGPLLARSRIRRMNRAALPLAASLFLTASVALAQVAPHGARLSYTRGPGTEGCPEEPSPREIVASQLGGVDPFVRDGAWRVEVVVQRRGPAFQGEIALHESDGRALGRQELSSPICGVLVESCSGPAWRPPWWSGSRGSPVSAGRGSRSRWRPAGTFRSTPSLPAVESSACQG
ncbi:hypothetical protein WME95_45530 [Sorangium sp. So ce327]|uniref:hypothetical protein n=1 Tax=Sorangium sp. So ce327 TaxID=3133301 RepID=UPI003F5EF080